MASFSSKFLKKRFAKAKDLEAFSDRAAPILRLANKVEQGGSSIAEPVIYDGPQGWSYDLTSAQLVSSQADRGASAYEEFNSSYGQYFGSAKISARAVAGSKTNEDAYLRQLTEVMGSSLKKFGSIAARRILGPVGGSLGRVSSVSTGVVTLTNRGDAANFAPGMIVTAAAADGSNGTITARVNGFVIAVDLGAGTVTLSATSGGAAGTPTGYTTNDYLFRAGDIATSTDLSDAAIRSLQAWVTLTAANDTYNGVNRAQDGRLSGIRVPTNDLAGMNVLDRMTLLVNECMNQAGSMDIDYIVCGPRTWQQAADEGKQFGRFEFGGAADTKIGVSALTVNTVSGAVKVIADPHCLESDIWAMTSENLKIYNYDGFPALTDADGVEILREAGAANYEVRWHAFNSVTVNGKPWTFGRCASGN